METKITTEQAISELNEQAKAFFQVKNLHFKWTVSRGRDTYGYNICTLLVDGDKVASCNGGGYDMQGTAFGEWLQNSFQDRLVELFKDEIRPLLLIKPDGFNANASKFYGAKLHKGSTKPPYISLDGGCGMESMKRIAEAIGITLKWNKESDKYKNHSFYTAFIN